MTTAQETHWELAHRSTAGVDVSLLWTKVGDLLTLRIRDRRSNEVFELEVPRRRALDAFRRPHAYLAEARMRPTELAAA